MFLFVVSYVFQYEIKHYDLQRFGSALDQFRVLPEWSTKQFLKNLRVACLLQGLLASVAKFL